MEYTDKEYCLEVWGDYACFTRPELKVERVSYDVITPSAARAIFEAILFKRYAMRWQMTRIEVLKPIKWTSVRRNEVGATASTKSTGIYIEDKRQQKNSLLLKDVRYRIWARLVFIPVSNRPKEAFVKHKPGADEDPMQHKANALPSHISVHVSFPHHSALLIQTRTNYVLHFRQSKAAIVTLASCYMIWISLIPRTSKPCSIGQR